MPDRRRPSSALIYFIVLVLFLYLPILVLIISSFNDSVTLSFPPTGLTLRWYEEMLAANTLIDSVWNSIWVGVVSSALATLLGTMAAIAVMRYNFPGKGFFLGLAGLPLVIPAVVMGVALLILFRQVLDVDLSLWTVILAHTVINIPVALLMVSARLAGFNASLEEAAMDLGATYWGTLWRVTLPVSFPALAAAFLASFTTSFDEYAMSVFLVGTKATLPVYLYAQLRFPIKVPQIVALSSVIIVVSVALIVLSEWLRRIGQSPVRKEEPGV